MNKVTFGLEKVHVAFATEPTIPGTPEWAAPIAIPGAVRFTPKAVGGEASFFADNGPYFVTTANNGYTAELEMALVPDAVLVTMLGWRIDANGMLIEVASGLPTRFALMGEVAGDDKNRRFIYYDCQASRPAKEEKTKGESIEPNTDVLNLTIFPIEIDGDDIVKGQLELSATNTLIYEAFFGTVLTPAAAA